jgi:cold shock CspA family protein
VITQRLVGSVTSFSDSVGLGTVTADDGREFEFHCIEIADGSRTIEVGAQVAFTPLPRFGAWQAGNITPA